MNEEEFKAHIKELLKLSDILIKNENLYKEIIKYFKSIDFLDESKKYYLEFGFFSVFDYKNALSLLLDMDKGTTEYPCKYRPDILITSELLTSIRQASVCILNVIEDFRNNSFNYFVEKTRLEEYMNRDRFINIDYKNKSIGIYSVVKLGDGLEISVKRHWIVLERSEQNGDELIQEYSTNIKYGMGCTVDAINLDKLNKLPKAITKYMYEYYPDLLL